jgi:ABC-2 type transport system permease protein
MLKIYAHMWQLNWAEQWQYRANLLMYLLYWLVSPIIFLSVWRAVAASQGAVNGFTAGDFTAYYMTLLLVDNLTSQITIHILEYKIRDGTLAGDLLRPVHPILTGTLVNNLAFKTLNFAALLPVWATLYLLFRPDFSGVTLGNLLLAVPIIALGFAISFLLGAALTFVAFWTTRAYALSEFYHALTLLLGGLFVPLDLLPGALRQVAELLPFQLFLYFPIQLILGQLSPAQIGWNVGLQIVWLAIAFVLFQAIWQAGVRRFSAVGA